MTKIPHLRWVIVGLIFLASVLNYVDRQALSILAPTMQKELGLTDTDYATILNLFLVAYTLSFLASGKLVDKIGVRLSFAIFVSWWSLANLFTAFARSSASLGFFRFCLGLGEAGNWTAAPKAVAEWIPPRERGLAIGIYTLGATIGATIAPIVILAASARWGWQGAFMITGVVGLFWVIPWLYLYRPVADHPHLADSEKASLQRGLAEIEAASGGETNWGSWWRLFARADVWYLIFGRMLTDPVWYFFQFWFAKYLHDSRGLSQQELAVTWMIFLAADVGALAGGWYSGQLIKRHLGAVNSRLRTMLYSAVLVPVCAMIPFATETWMVIGLGMMGVFAHMAWLINLTALVVDRVPKGSLASVFGIVAAGSSIGGMLMNRGVGALVSDHSFDPAFYTMAVMHPIAWLLLNRLNRNKPPTSSSDANSSTR